MSYSDQKFYNREPFIGTFAASFGTATAGAAFTATITLPPFIRRTQVNKINFIVTTIPNAASTVVSGNLLNGTSTAAAAVLTTATAGQAVAGTVTAANAIFAAGVAPTVSVTGTATASAAANGAYTIELEIQELYA